MKIKLNGINAELELSKDELIIKRSWFLIRVFIIDRINGDEVQISKIQDIEYKEGTNISNGYLNFKLEKGEESIKFKRSSNKQAEKIYRTIKFKIDKVKREKSNYPSGATEIREYKELYDDGIITKEEYEQKKNRILNS